MNHSFELVSRGGFMMIPLLLSGLVALTVIFERIYALHFKLVTPTSAVDAIIQGARSGQLPENIPAAPVAEVLAAGARHFKDPAEAMELAMRNRAEWWLPRLEGQIGVIDTVITAAPLMGLLGTITGMMASFHALSSTGVSEPGAITSGVAEALIATATGLVIALVCLVFFNYLNARVRHLTHEIESAAAHLAELRIQA